ncbi:hypothetical protein Bca4012_096244 [Brassica carinata]
MIISAQTRPTPSPYKPRPAVQYISCHPYLALASSTCGFREAVASSVPPPLALRLMGSLQSDSLCVVAAEFPILSKQSLEVGFWWSLLKFSLDLGGQVLCLVR